MTIRSNFSDSGLDVGLNDTNMTYMYGLSDFFSVMFEDTSTVNLLLEAETEVASEVYSRFLQYTSSLSLQSLQEVTNSSIKLVMLSSSDLVSGQINTYILPENIQSSRYICNRAFLPTEMLDENVDYYISQQPDGACWVKFAKPLNSYALPVRLLNDGVTTQHALWFADVEVDEGLMTKFYGNLIGVSPENASTQFSDFVYGLFYVYTHGPKLDTLSRGLNLALGIPVARSQEQVLSIRKYLETDQYLVICDQNQYLIPYGLSPSVFEGDILSVGQSLAEWVEIKDYEHDGDWWINLHIPEKLVPQIPAGQKDRYATSGSHYDYLMRNYLKSHTFLVKVKVENFKNIQKFVQLSDIIKQAKPCYTEAIYVWTIVNTEYLNPTDPLTYSQSAGWDDSIHPCISRLRRNNVDDPVVRGRRTFIRYNADISVEPICGTDPYTSNYITNVGADIINGYVNSVNQFRANTNIEQGWIKTILFRGHGCYHGFRNKIGFNRGAADPGVLDGTSETLGNSKWGIDLTMKMVPLYTTTVSEMSNKMISIGLQPPTDIDWWFEIFSPRSYSQAIDAVAVNYLPPIYDAKAASNNYSQFFFRTNSSNYLGREFGPNSEKTWAPDPSLIQPGDYLLCVRSTSTVVGVYWVTSSMTTITPPYFTVGEIDPINIKFTAPVSRGIGHHGAPFYVMRGAGSIDGNYTAAAINSVAIDDPEGSSGTLTPVLYKDLYNITPTSIDRSKVFLTHTARSSALNN